LAVAALQPRALLNQLKRFLAVLWYPLPAVREDPSEVSARRQVAERDGLRLLIGSGSEIASGSKAFRLIRTGLSLRTKVTG
jgi:hypothetical protein